MASQGQLVGHVLGGRYRLIGILGEGGVGTVYEAVQEDLGRKVAVKVLHLALAPDPAWARRMEREARATAALDHPHIVQINDFQLTPGGLPFLVMERLTGRSLRDLVEKEAPLPASRVVNIALQVLAALDVAHRAGIVHRDIKPENVFLVTTPATPDFVKVLDFGIAKAVEGTAAGGALSLTHTGAVLGTAGYMPPEQARGEPLDARADIFALGACMYEALSGGAATDEPSALARRRPDLDPALAAIVTRALATDRSARFATAQEMIEALQATAAVSLRPPRPSPSASELAPTDPMARPLVATPRAQPQPPLVPRAQSSRLGWLVAALVALFILVPACVIVALVVARSQISSPPLDERDPAKPKTTASAPPDEEDDDDTAPVATSTTSPTSTSTIRRLHAIDAGPSPRPSPTPTPSPSPSPSPSPAPSASREPWENPPPLVAANATFQKALSIDDAAIVASLQAFTRTTIAPITRECFRKIGFGHQSGQTVASEVQLTIHADGHIDSFVDLTFGAVRQADCVDTKLRATPAPGVCRNTRPASCTIYVKLEGTYR